MALARARADRGRSAKAGLATAEAVETFVPVMFSSIRDQNDVGRRLGRWLPWLVGWPMPVVKCREWENGNTKEWIALKVADPYEYTRAFLFKFAKVIPRTKLFCGKYFAQEPLQNYFCASWEYFHGNLKMRNTENYNF